MRSALLLLILASFGLSMARADDSSSVVPFLGRPEIPTEALDEALGAIMCTRADLGFITDHVDPDSFRLPIVDSMTVNPLDAITFSQRLSEYIFSMREFAAMTLVGYASEGFAALHPTPPSKAVPDPPDPPVEYITMPETLPGCYQDDGVGPLSELLGSIYGHIANHKNECLRFMADLSENEQVFIHDSLKILILDEEGLETKSVEYLDSLQKWEDSLLHRFEDIAVRLYSEPDYRQSRALVDKDGFTLLISISLACEQEFVQMFGSGDCEFQFEASTPLGVIAIGGNGANHYVGEYIVIFDFGGNDTYSLRPVASPQIIRDMGGNDSYIADSGFALASGFLYPAMLVDDSGDDYYSGGNFSLGSGLFSLGVLVDRGGDDTYVGDTHTQGAGTFGVGMLMDYEGMDQYRCALFGQAFAGVMGVGVLCDVTGNDTYTAGNKYLDVLRYSDHYTSLSQGFAYGWRPLMSGGVALLADSSGHDTYISDIFGQGSSYWYALGMQTDYSGNDRYLSFQYAQGAATHLCASVLVDKLGNDQYSSKGVSQGCGHDLASGMLVDYKGDDCYTAWDLSQAAGSANGFGMLIDYEGSDNYQIRGRGNTQGYGNPRRDYGSIGVFMDLMGEDYYIGNGSNNKYWIGDSKWGVGMDIEFWSRPR